MWNDLKLRFGYILKMIPARESLRAKPGPFSRMKSSLNKILILMFDDVMEMFRSSPDFAREAEALEKGNGEYTILKNFK